MALAIYEVKVKTEARGDEALILKFRSRQEAQDFRLRAYVMPEVTDVIGPDHGLLIMRNADEAIRNLDFWKI